MIPLAAKRAGGMTWEYYFSFDGGSPPWTSAMSQATGLEALTRAFKATGNEYYLNIAGRALPVFRTRRRPASRSRPGSASAFCSTRSRRTSRSSTRSCRR